MKNKLTRTGFVAWLKSKHPRTRVGQSLAGLHACPLARFTGWTIGTTVYWIDAAKGSGSTLPKWARDFVKAVDAVQGGKSPQITASKALALLGE